MDADREEMEKSLLDKGGEEEVQSLSSITLYGKEVKRAGCMAGPLVAVNFSQYFLQIISVMMVGHLGQLYLSSTALAISFCAVTGFSLVFGMATALETLNGQAYGAQQYKKLGIQTYTALFCLVLACFPLSLMWIYMGKILTFMGQDPVISGEAGKFTMWLVPALFGYAILQSLVQYYQAQSLTFPLLLSSCITLFFHVIACWVLVFKSGLGNLGAALAIGMSYWLNVVLLGSYMYCSSTCAKTRVPLSFEIFQRIGQFFRLAVPSAIMMGLSWWSFEFLTVLSGLLPNPKLETSVLSVCLSTISTLSMIPDGLSAVASVRVSNELGAGNPQAASVAVKAMMFLAVLESIIVSAAVFACRHAFGYLFSNEKEVVNYVTAMAPWLCLTVILDSFRTVLSGVARGCGWQDLGAYIIFVAYYICGIPVAALLGFWLDLRGQGLLIGIQIGSLLQTVLLAIITSCTNWEKQVIKAKERIFPRASSRDNDLA